MYFYLCMVCFAESDIYLENAIDSEWATQNSQDTMKTKSEWVLLDLNISETHRVDIYGQTQNVIVYTVSS